MTNSSLSIKNCMYGLNQHMPTNLTREDFDRAIVALVTNNVKTVTQHDPKFKERYGHFFLSDFFFALVPESFVKDIHMMAGFLPVAGYPDETFAFKDEIGCLGNARIIKFYEQSMILENSRSNFDKLIYWIDFCNEVNGPSLLRLRCTKEGR